MYDIPWRKGNQEAVLLAPQKGGPSIELGYVGSRLMMAVIRNGYLWTCHHIGLDGSDGDYDGETVDRSAIQWLKLRVEPDGRLTYAARGRIYDDSQDDPYWFYYPSLNVNAKGDVVIGFSGSRQTEYIGAFFYAFQPTGWWMWRPCLIQAGRCSYDSDRLGDYSATTGDPNDDSLWTIQKYADPAVLDNFFPWGTWIVQVKPGS